MHSTDQQFAQRAIQRKRLFVALSFVGIGVAVVLLTYYAIQRWHDHHSPFGLHLVLVILILLNARQNYRQYKYARVLEQLMR